MRSLKKMFVKRMWEIGNSLRISWTLIVSWHLLWYQVAQDHHWMNCLIWIHDEQNKSMKPTNSKISYFLHQCLAIDSSHTYYRLFCLTVVFVDDDDCVVGWGGGRLCSGCVGVLTIIWEMRRNKHSWVVPHSVYPRDNKKIAFPFWEIMITIQDMTCKY